jgi:hypothetical protein
MRYLLNEVTSSMKTKGRSVEELNEEARINGREFLVHVTVHLYNLIKELQGAGKFITEVYDNKKASKFELQLWENLLKLVNFHT